jgi:uncharacterized membrane protein
VTETAVIAALWLGFAATHMSLASLRLRPALVARMGEQTFQGVFSLVALAFFVPLCWYYFGGHKHAGPLLWAIPMTELLRWIIYVGNGAAFVLVVAGIVTPSPAVTGKPAEPRGVQLLTRHSMFMGIGLWGATHLLVNGYASDVAYFAGFPVYTLLGSRHQDTRKRQTLEGYAAFCERSPFVPFTGAGSDTLRGLLQLSPLAVVLGIAITIALRWFHGPLFGP